MSFNVKNPASKKSAPVTFLMIRPQEAMLFKNP